MIVTLAGHVDHGKTTLVRHLTGRDTDRLAEEKRRGLTIDLGFAYLEDGDTTVGFVDVPGHHRFIHNMVAGVASRQHALLVVAADDGPMPQTREHLQILELLGVKDGVVALTKCDRVSDARRSQAIGELRALLRNSFLQGAEVVETAAGTGEPSGIEPLRRRLLERARRTRLAPSPRPFRMAVDRAFQIKGTGLVVTGTVHDGQVAVNEPLLVFPSGARGRVRSLHVQNQPAEVARAGDRMAVNLTGVDATNLHRGDWLTAEPEPGHHSIVVDLRLLEDFPRPLRHFAPVHVYHATSHSTARLALLEGSKIAPGQRGWAQLELDRPLMAKRGDRLVIRDHALERTLGGGEVLDNTPAPSRRRAPARLRAVAARAAEDPAAALDALLALGPVELTGFRHLWHLSESELEALCAARPATVRQNQLVSDSHWESWRQALLEECRQRHRADQTLQGLRENEFEAVVPAAFRGGLLESLVAGRDLEQRAGRYRPAQHRVALSAAEQDLLNRLTPLLDQPQPPSLGDLGKALRMPLAKLSAAVKPLAAKGSLVQVTDKRLYLAGHLLELADTAAALSASGPFTARDYRDAAGIGRNVAIDLLEFFDARGFTRRQGDTRTVVGERSRLLPS